MTEPAIFIQQLTKSYGSVQALRGVDLEVCRGEIFGFLGPNGAGKTTTIRCLLDLIRPNGGRARVLGLDPQKQSVQVRARSGYLPGELAFDGNLTVEAGLRYLTSLRGNKLDWGYVRSLAERLSLDLKPQFKNLSKGNKQKVGVVQALMHRPELLLLDEPTAGLDPLMQQEVLRMVREAKQEGVTVFFSSHIISEVEELAERVGIIREGRVAETVKLEVLRPFIVLYAMMFLFQMLGLLLSLLLLSRSAANMVAGLLLVGSYFVNALSEFNEFLDKLADYLPMRYYQSGYAIEGLNGEWLLGLFGFGLLFALLAWVLFLRRDIRVSGEGSWRLPAWLKLKKRIVKSA